MGDESETARAVMTDDEIKGLLRGLSRLAPPWEVRKVHPFGWDVRSTRWADENTIVAHCSGHGADGDARLIAAAPYLAAEVLRLRAERVALDDHDAAVRADERAVLARAVPPMTMSAGRDEVMRAIAADNTYENASHMRELFAEIDALRAALTARDAEIATLRADLQIAESRKAQAFRDLHDRAEKAEAALSREREAHARLVEAAKAVRDRFIDGDAIHTEECPAATAVHGAAYRAARGQR